MEGASLHSGRQEGPLKHDIDDDIRPVAQALARALLSGESDARSLRQRATRALGRAWPWLKRLVRDALLEFGPDMAPRDHDDLVAWLCAFPPLLEAFVASDPAPQVRGRFPWHPRMGPAPWPGLPLPPLATAGDLADWLAVSPSELDWFADPAGWGSRGAASALRHYDCRWLPKPAGGMRLIEAPKRRLREIQRRILRGILDQVPVHPAAHGCVPGRSPLSSARAHACRPMVLRVDLADFFPSIPASRVHALFTTLGYPAQTARYLTGLTTHCPPPAIARSVPMEPGLPPGTRRVRQARAKRFLERHLPQGAPTSPALAFRLDLRLAGAAEACGARYTRYVDDLVFSLADASSARARRMVHMIYTIALEEGFAPNVRKTRLMPAAGPQRVTGLTVNERPNVSREHYDRLKAILTNCARHGPAGQNREGRPDFRAYLRGHVAHVEQVHAGHGARLRALFEAICWD